MKKLFIFFGLFVGLLLNTGYAGNLFEYNKFQVSSLTFSKRTQISAKYFNPLTTNQTVAYQDTLTKEQRLAQLPGYKLPKRALLFSALIPGAGELYAKSYLKAAAFFLVEAGAWTFCGIYNKKGNEKEDEYQQFANEKWNPMKWSSWYENIPEDQRKSFTHASHMEELIKENRKTQQYFEMIGKYAEFVVGWENVPSDLTYEQILDYRRNQCEIADQYMQLRAKSNDLFEKARTGTTIAMLNHLLSAIDAAWTAKIHNNRLLQSTLRFEQIYYANHRQPVLSLKISW